MGTLTACLKKAGPLLKAEDRSFILNRAAELRRGGMSAKDAGVKAVEERLAELTGMLGDQPGFADPTTSAPTNQGADDGQGQEGRGRQEVLNPGEASASPTEDATHKEAGSSSEPVTPAVVAKSLVKAADNRDRKPSEMKRDLLRMVDEAMPNASDEYLWPTKEPTKKEIDAAARDGRMSTALAERTIRNSRENQYAEAANRIGFVTFKVPGDGTFKVLNTADRLKEFRAKVEASAGFKDSRSTTQPNRVDGDGSPFGVERGSGGPKATIQNMVDDGDPQAAVDFAAARGLDINDVLNGDKARLSKVAGLEPTAEAVGEFEAEDATEPAASPAKEEPDALAMTPKQYHDAKLRSMAEANDVTLAEVREMYDTDGGRAANEQEWVRRVVEAAQSGTTLTRATLDKLLELRPTTRLPETAIPEGYQRPEARKAESQAKDAIRQDRREAKAERAGVVQEGDKRAGQYEPSEVFAIYRSAESAARGLWSSSGAGKHNTKLRQGLRAIGLKQAQIDDLMAEAATVHAQRTRGSSVMSYLSGQDFMAGARRAGVVPEPATTPAQQAEPSAPAPTTAEDRRRAAAEVVRKATVQRTNANSAMVWQIISPGGDPLSGPPGVYPGKEGPLAGSATMGALGWKTKREADAALAELNRKADEILNMAPGATLADRSPTAKKVDEMRNSFTLQRLNRETNEMQSVTFARGEYVEVALIGSDKRDFGDIDGISQSRREFSVNGLWHPFGAAYKATRPEPAKKDTVPMSKVVDAVNKKYGAGLGPADAVSVFEAFKATMRAVYDGTASMDDYKSAYRRVRDAEAVKAELGKLTKEELVRTFGIMAGTSEKKDSLVATAYKAMLRSFALGKQYGPTSYMMTRGGLENYERQQAEALDAIVENHTADDLAAYAAEVKAEREAEAVKRAASAEAIKNPKTLDEYRRFMSYHTRDGKSTTEVRLSMLTPEQRAEFDLMLAEESRSRRKVMNDDQRTQVRVAGQTVDGNIIATKHTKKGHDLYVVQLAERVSREDYETLNTGAKKIGGYYSSFRGGGAIPGFQFTTREQAQAFVTLAGGDATAAKEAAQERRDAYADDRSQSAAERLTEMAEAMDAAADESLSRERKANTARRARFAAAAEAGAREAKAMAKTMRNVAQALTGGKAKFLDRVRTKTQVELLQTYVANAKGDQLRAKYPTYAEQEKRKGQPPTQETADYAEFPTFTAFRSDLASLGRQLQEVDGTKKIGDQLMKVADDVSDAFTAWVKEPGNYFRVAAFSTKGTGERAAFTTKDAAERAIARSGYRGKAIPWSIKRGEWAIIFSPSEAVARGLWTGDGDKRIALSGEFGSELVDKIGRANRRGAKVSVPWQFERAYERRKQLQRMGIETPAEFRAALREFIGLREQAAEADRIKMLERAMVGKAKDGLDFFPTPEGTADEMVAAADIEPGMRVLEPSAGMGHIADRIRAAGAEPDVGEFAGDRRELLEAKGYNVVATDFLSFTDDNAEARGFTFGDVFRAPDGTLGVLRGSNGMGGSRVGLDPLDDKGQPDPRRARWETFSELEPVEKRGAASGYDRILMNPPFSNGRDIDHVRHAYTLLKPGGRIVALMGESAFTNQNKRATEFREWLESVGGTDEKLPEGSFMDPSLPVNTGANARMVVIDKTGNAPQLSRAGTDKIGLINATARELAKSGIQVNVADTVADLPQELRAAFMSSDPTGKARGAYFPGVDQVWLVAENLSGTDEMVFVTLHEAFHRGLHVVMGEQGGKLLRELYGMNKRVRDLADAQMSRFGIGKEEAINEALADLAGSGEAQSLRLWGKLVTAVRAWLRKIADAAGVRMDWNDNDVLGLVASMTKAGLTEPQITQAQWRGEMAMASRQDIDTNDPMSVVDVLLEWGRQAETQYPKTDATTVEEIAKAKGATSEESTITQMDGSEKGTGYWTVNLPAKKGEAAPKPVTMVVRGNEVWINASALLKGQGGSLAYDIAAQFALNTGRVFIGDPDGVSQDALRRRLENMLSSAIKYGTTDHIAPHKDQLVGEYKLNLPPLKWQTGDTRGNIYSMLRAADATNEANQNLGSSVGYDAGAGAFVTEGQVPLDDPAGAFALLSKDDRGTAGAGAAGSTTLQRAAFFRALLREPAARRSLLERLRGLKGRGGQADGRRAPEVDGALYSRAGGTLRADALASLQDLKLPAGYRLGDFLQSHGKLSWWDKTVGTMHNLAKRNALFRPVYERATEFLNDVSYYATEAADLAPTLLPKMEALRDIAKQPVSAEDTKAVSSAIFEGTLNWTRDTNGQPVEEPDVSKAGIRWTDDELRSKFKLNPQQIGLYHEFRAAVDRSIKGLSVSDILAFGGRDLDDVRERILAADSASQAARIAQDHLAKLAETADAGRAAVLTDTGTRIGEKAQQTERLIERGYAPLMRFGHYTVDAVDKAGERIYFGLFESQADANRFARKLGAEFKDADIRQGTMSDQAYQMFSGVSPETVELFGNMLGLESQGNKAADAAFQEYLKLAKSNRSAMKRMIQRKGVEGYSEDAGRVLAGFVYSNARQTSKNLHLGKMAAAVNDIAEQQGQGELLDVAVKLHQFVSNPQEEAQKIKGLLFAQYLGGSLAAGMVNLSQTVMVSFPYLTQFTSVMGAARAMTKALKDAGKWELAKEADRTTGDKALDEAIRRAEEEGTISPQEVHSLMAQASGRGALKAGDGTLAGDAAANAHNALSKIGLLWGRPFAMAEQFNRRATFIAAYRLAVEKGMDDPAGFAKTAIDDTQFVYTKASRPQWARGAVGSVLFTFKTYSISYVELLKRMAANGPEGRKAALVAVATLVLMSGIDGLPGAGDMDDLIDGFLQHLGYNFSSKRMRQEFLAGIIGEDGAKFVTKGVSGLPGAPIDVAGRLGLGNMIPGTGLLTKKTDHTQDVAELAGPAGAMVTGWFKGADAAMKGEIGEGAMAVAPVAASNVIKAIDMASTGMYRDQRGRKVLDVDGYDAMVKAIGFQPNDVARVQNATREVQRTIDLTRMRETEIADKWARGVFERKPEMVREARDELAMWNADNPEAVIRINSAQVVKRVKQMSASKEERVAKTAPKEIRAEVKRELEAAR